MKCFFKNKNSPNYENEAKTKRKRCENDAKRYENEKTNTGKTTVLVDPADWQGQ